MTSPRAHLSDELLSAIVDQQLATAQDHTHPIASPNAAVAGDSPPAPHLTAQLHDRDRFVGEIPPAAPPPEEFHGVDAQGVDALAHLRVCGECQLRLEELRRVVDWLRALPSVDPPRDFQLGPRLLIDAPNVIRLRRWYGVARASAASLAAACVFLSAGALYVDSQPAVSPSTLSRASATSSQPNAPAPPQSAVSSAPAGSVPAPAAPLQSAAGSAPAAPVATAQAAPAGLASGAVARSQAAPAASNADAADQVAAATSVRPLPTPVPTRPSVPPQASAAPLAGPVDSAAPWRAAAAIVGMLAAFGVVAALIVRHRLRAATHLFKE